MIRRDITGIKRLGFDRHVSVSFRVDADALKRVQASLDSLPPAVSRKVARSSIRLWGKAMVASVRAVLPKRTGRLRRSLAVRVRSNRYGIWAAVGGRVRSSSGMSGEEKRAGYKRLGWDYLGAGWRLHFVEGGFRPGGGPTRLAGLGVLARASRTGSAAFEAQLMSDIEKAKKEVGL